tara:strand:+ start:120922 stop:122358 length:1437 start_codon:yes stop_codon:yes gene_type:complete
MTKLYQNYIDGKFVVHNSSNVTEVLNPATHELLAHTPSTTREVVDEAVDAARKAQVGWAKLPAIQRAVYLRKVAEKIRENKEKLAVIITQEQGKILDLARIEVDFTADYIDYMAEWARRIEGEIIPSDRVNENIFLMRRPIGVTAGILPWNFPFFLIARKMAPALITGNTIVIKPSEETPINAFEFARLVDEAGLPPGVFNLVGGSGSDVGAQLVDHPNIDLVSFTGSVSTGKKIMMSAARNLTRVNLELGGKAPAIVLASADLDLAAKAICDSRIINSGQVCNCVERVYVERSVSAEFIDKITSRMAAIRYGDPMKDKDLDMGPLMNQQSLDRIAAMVIKAKEDGADVLVGGGLGHFEQGFHYQPTVITNCSHDMEIMREEIFGPVLPIQIVDSMEEAISLSNDSEFGLTSSIFTRDLSKAMQACNELQFGETYINREHFEAMQGFHAGRRNSGIGGADGKHGLLEYTETQVIYMQY